MKLDPDAVRRRASSIEGCVALPSDSTDSVVSFLVGVQSDNEEKRMEDLARVTIFCETGTVATGRVMLGAVRHTFRKNVSSLDVVERALRTPDAPLSIQWNLVGPEDDGKPVPLETQRSPVKNIELVDMSVAILRGEREKLAQHAANLEATSTSKTTATTPTSPKSPASASKTSMEFQFSLAAGPMKHVDQCLSDINKMGKLVRGVSTNGAGTVFLYGNGGVAYTPNIPRALYHRLSQLRHSKSHASRPSYVSLGTRERFFVAFYDGTFSYKGPKTLDRELRKITKPPKSVAFGTNYDTFFLVFHDGTFKTQGRGIPVDLETKLNARDDPPLLACVNLGPSGEWFLRSQDGRVGWGGGSEEMDEAIQELLDGGHYVNFLDFGESGSYFVSYD